MRMALSYIYYRIHAKNRHGVHSPFFYNLNEQVLAKKTYPFNGEIESLRADLLKDKTKINLIDLGAGSRVNNSNNRSISEIARVSSGSQKDLSLLFNLATWMKAEHILELGTNLGLATIALSKVPTAKHVISIEGDPTLTDIAVKNLEKLNANAQVLQGSFEENLDLALLKLPKLDFAYIDGNHQKRPTLEYFNQIKKYSGNDSVIVIGDIHWSAEMEKAWEIVKADPEVRASADIFSMGLVFFKKELSKEHFILHG